MTSCGNTTPRRTCARACPAIYFPASMGRAFWLGLALAGSLLAAPAASAAPNPIQNDFANGAVLATLPAVVPNPLNDELTADGLADQLQQLIGQSRSTGDPRFLGYAERLLQNWRQGRPESDLNDRLRVLRATLAQSLHRFDAARRDLKQVLETSNQPQQRIQARLTLANLELVQGRYDDARRHCLQLARIYPGLIADSCLAQTNARTGQAASAHDRLQTQLASARTGDATSRLWALGTLGDLAAQLGQETAATHWRRVLSQAPEDLYTRAQLAEWQLQAGNPEAALTLTAGYEQVDSLAVIRSIALRETSSAEAERLVSALRERFAEAQWRGDLLHQRDFARFQLDVENRPELALEHARANWQDQREPLDTRLLLRAAQRAGDRATLENVRQWLTRHSQADHRYPEGL